MHSDKKAITSLVYSTSQLWDSTQEKPIKISRLYFSR